jgi:hypothetical protein
MVKCPRAEECRMRYEITKAMDSGCYYICGLRPPERVLRPAPRTEDSDRGEIRSEYDPLSEPWRNL